MANVKKTLQLLVEVQKRGDEKIKELQKKIVDLEEQVDKHSKKTKRASGDASNALRGLVATGGDIRGAFTGALLDAAESSESLMSTIAQWKGPLIAAGVGIAAVTAALIKLRQVLAEAREAWTQQEEAELTVAAVWRSMGRDIPTDEIHAYASELQKASIYGDEQIASATRILGTFPQIADNMIKPTMQSMIDFAATANISLDSAAAAMGKAAMGMGGELRRMGVTISDAAIKSGDFPRVLAEINEQIGGQAAAKAATWGGKVKQLQNVWGDLLEELGRIQALGFGDYFGDVTAKIAEMATGLKKAIEAGQLDPFIRRLQEMAEVAKVVTLAMLELSKEAAKSSAFIVDQLIKPYLQYFEAIKKVLVFLGKIPPETKSITQQFMEAAGLSIAQMKNVERYMQNWAEKRKASLAANEKQQQEADKKALAALKEISENYKILIQAVEQYYGFLLKSEDLFLEKNKARITSEVADTIRAKQQLLQLEIDSVAKRLDLIREENEERKKAIDAQQKEELEKANAINDSDKKEKAIADIERKYKTELAKINQDYTKKLESELQKQYNFKQRYAEQIKGLNDQITQTEKATADALRNLQINAASEYDRLNMKLDDANAKLRQATELMPTFPERALQLAKEAQQQFAALGQDVNALQNNLKSNQALVADTLAKISQANLKGTQKYRAEVANTLDLIKRARSEAAEGRVKEAEALYKQALSAAQSLTSAAPEGKKRLAQADADLLARTAGRELLALNKDTMDKAADANQQVAEGIQASGELLKSELERQVAAAQKQVDAVEKNTAALEALRAAMTGEKPGTTGIATATSTETQKSTITEGLKDAANNLGSAVADSLKSGYNAFAQNVISARTLEPAIVGAGASGETGAIDLKSFGKLDTSANRLDQVINRLIENADKLTDIKIRVTRDDVFED